MITTLLQALLILLLVAGAVHALQTHIDDQLTSLRADLDAATAAHTAGFGAAEKLLEEIRDQRDVAEARALEAESALEAERAASADSGYRDLIDRRVVANVRDGGAIRGVLHRVYADSLTLRSPEQLGPEVRHLGPEILLALRDVPSLQLVDEDA